MELNPLSRIALIVLYLFAVSVQAAELSGRVWYERGKQAAGGVRIAITCPASQRFEARSDGYGFYRLSGLPARQSCYILIDDGQRYSEPLSFYSGQGRETMNFTLLLQDQRLIVKKR